MRTRATIAAFVLAALGLAAVASAAGITVYSASFKNRDEVKDMRHLSGSKEVCRKDWRDKSALGVTVKGGPVDCALSTPVQGDSPQPNQVVRVMAKLNKATDEKVKENIYVGVIVRAGPKESYELRVFPKGKKFQLLKSGEVLQQGKEGTIAGPAKKNRLQIEVKGQRVTGNVNGKDLAEFKDENAEQVEGRQTGVTYGNRGRSKKGEGVAVFDQLKVQVPTR